MHMFEPLQNFLPKAAQEYKFTRQFKAIQICQEYRNIIEKIFSKEALKQTIPKAYQNQILTINVYNSVWAQQITMHKHRILEEINLKFGPKTLKKIHIVLAEQEN